MRVLSLLRPKLIRGVAIAEYIGREQGMEFVERYLECSRNQGVRASLIGRSQVVRGSSAPR